MKFQNEFYDPNKICFFHLDSIYDMDGIVQKWHQPTKTPNVLKPEMPWEADMTLPTCVLPHHADDKLVCYYRSIGDRNRHAELREKIGRCVGSMAYSEDGLTWERPELGIVEYDGKPTNILGDDENGWNECNAIMDPHDPDPNRRYKGMTLRFPHNDVRIEDARLGRCYYASTSADGIHWQDQGRIDMFDETGDTQGLVWDERAKLYRFTTRKRGYWLSDRYPKHYSRPIKKGMPDGRWVAVCNSTDFENWTDPDNILVRDAQDELGVDFYCAVIFPYADIYLGLLRRHHHWHGLMDTELVWSRDAVRWNRSWYRNPFLSWGELGDEDWCFGAATNCKPIRRGDDILIYYEARQHVHAPHRSNDGRGLTGMDATMGVSTLRLDGFVSLEAGRMGGELITEPLPIAGKKVFLNIRTVGDGVAVIDLCDANREAMDVEQVKIQGNHIRLPLKFAGNDVIPTTDSGLASLKIFLQNAAIYSITFETE